MLSFFLICVVMTENITGQFPSSPSPFLCNWWSTIFTFQLSPPGHRWRCVPVSLPVGSVGTNHATWWTLQMQGEKTKQCGQVCSNHLRTEAHSCSFTRAWGDNGYRVWLSVVAFLEVGLVFFLFLVLSSRVCSICGESVPMCFDWWLSNHKQHVSPQVVY